MPSISLLLGPILFQDFEVPASVSLGGAQRVAVHRLIGGARVIDTLGRDDADIRFSGVLSGENATLRARTLDELRTSGVPLPVTWDVFYYTVILTKFEADYRSGWWIPFRIECTVVRDEAAGAIDSVVSLAQSAISDVLGASTWSNGAAPSLDSLQNALAAPDAATLGSADYVTAQAGLLSAQSGLRQAIGAAEATIENTALSSATSAPTGVAALGTATGAAQQLGGLVIAQGYLGRAATNLANAST